MSAGGKVARQRSRPRTHEGASRRLAAPLRDPAGFDTGLKAPCNFYAHPSPHFRTRTWGGAGEVGLRSSGEQPAFAASTVIAGERIRGSLSVPTYGAYSSAGDNIEVAT
jgi:hypothetical protein